MSRNIFWFTCFTLMVCLFVAALISPGSLFTRSNSSPDLPPLYPTLFQRGDMVTLKITGHGQILSVHIVSDEIRYLVRVPTDKGPRMINLYEFELTDFRSD